MTESLPLCLRQENTNCVRFISGRAALGCILDHFPAFRRVHIPVFTCDTILEPFLLRGIPVKRYHINEDLSPILPEDITSDDLLLLTNYFGYTNHQVSLAASQHPGAVIVDASTALFSEAPAHTACFYSPRKFCHLPTGGIALTPFPLTKLPPFDTTDWQLLMQADAHFSKQMQIIRQEKALRHRTERLGSQAAKCLNAFDWATDANQRLRNYDILHRELRNINRLALPDKPAAAPMCYPLLSGIPQLRDDLADSGLPLPLFWPEVIRQTSAADTENYLARNLLPLPIGPLLAETDMHHILDLIFR